MSNVRKTTRPRCEQCLRPVSHCLCAAIQRVSNRTRVLILQHPDEAKHPLNTARLAVLGLERAELLVGERFPELDALLASTERALLLFPDDPSVPRTNPVPEVQINSDISPSQPSLLIVPDGTWRKARRIVRLNPELSILPRISLPAGEPSTYRVRKAREEAAVSTIEAIERALSILEPERDFKPLLQPFDALVAQQIEAMGEGVFSPQLFSVNLQGTSC